VNDLVQLAGAESVLRARINEKCCIAVSSSGARSTLRRRDVELAPEVSLLPGTVLKGHCVVERGARIGPTRF